MSRRTKKPGRPVRWDRIEAAREKIESGFYQDPRNWIDAPGVRSRIHRDLRLLRLLESCGWGLGDEFRDLVAGILVRALGPIVDEDLMRKEFPARG